MCDCKKRDKKPCLIVLFYFAIFLKIYFDRQCEESPYEQGIKLIYSGAIEEERLACYLQCESKRIQLAAKKLKANPCKKIDTKDLIKANCCVKKKLRCIESIEECILKKINMGKRLIFSKNSCCPISCIDNSCGNTLLVFILIMLLIKREKCLCYC